MKKRFFALFLTMALLLPAALSTARRIGSFDFSSSQSMLRHARSKSVWVDSGSFAASRRSREYPPPWRSFNAWTHCALISPRAFFAA